jgi:hypothetical protein
MGLRKPVDFSELPKNLKPEIAERVAEHFKDGVFEFDFSTEEMIAVEGNTVYQLMAGGGVVLIGMNLIPLLANLFNV